MSGTSGVSPLLIGSLSPRSLDAAAARDAVGATACDADAFVRMLAAAGEPGAIAGMPVAMSASGMVPLNSPNVNVPLETAERAVMPFTVSGAGGPLPVSVRREALPLNVPRAMDADEVRESAEQLVASALLMPLLEQLNTSPLRPLDGPFAQTLGEKRFGPLLHQHLADRMMKSRNFGLVDAVVDHLRGSRIEVMA